ncbi:helix-turn-helix domain-containing protein [Sulfitobacter sp. JB4-11]|uniref:helix-turn-helix domain-containing protein n=1 Tax=Sulfitobacter rhodophyticola TaxID=3238304 RepID=UPI003D813B22
MIGRWSSRIVEEEQVEPKGFDAFDLRLGDIMRGERATMGKSLLDVQRELRIKASYIAAIENCDPDAFDTPGFIAGYVRSYARYLSMDPDKAFETFCAESGFSVAHGMSAEASVIKKSSFADRKARNAEAELFARSKNFTPVRESVFSQIEPAAIGSMVVLVALIGAIGFGGWSVLKEVQRVQVAPVDQTPVVLSDLDPLDGALGQAETPDVTGASDVPRVMEAPRVEALDRLYRPQALDVPVLVARDAPIATIDPRSVGNFANIEEPTADSPVQVAQGPRQPLSGAPGTGAVPQVVETLAAPLRMVAAYPSWVRVRAADGTVIFEGIMEPGDTWDVPATEEPPILRTGESGALYFAMADGCFGPVGPRGSVTSNLPLHEQALAELYDRVDPTQDQALNTMFADLAQTDTDAAVLAALPCQTQ